MISSVRRRDFLLGTGAVLILGKSGRAAWAKAGTKPMRVRVDARIGTPFPSLGLARKLAASTHGYEILRLTEGGGGRGGATVIELAIFPDDNGAGDSGLLTAADLSELKTRIAAILADEYGYLAESVSHKAGPGFWYPFIDRRAVCCRLVITPD